MAIAAKEYKRRREQLWTACEDLHLDAILTASNGSCFGLSGRSQGYMSFLCGWNSFDSPSALILQKGQAPKLIVSHHRMMMMARDTVPDVEVSWIDQDSFGHGVKRALQGASGRVGLCGWEDVIARSWQSVEEALADCELVDIKDRFNPLRAIKSPEQLALQRKAAAICDGMFDRLSKTEIVGRYTYQIKAEIECFAKQAGAEFVQHWLTVGYPPDYPRYFHNENKQVPKLGDLLIYGMQILIGGFWGHAVRTYSLGPVSNRHAAVHAAVISFQENFMNLMRPGINMGDMVREGFEHINEVYDAIGKMKVDMLRLGHGIGYSYTDPGTSEAFPRSYYKLEDELARPVPTSLQPGMVFEVHPIFFYEDGAAGVGDMIEITGNGPSFMTNFPRTICELSERKPRAN
jgi:Xaa-Pro aminopeptidase